MSQLRTLFLLICAAAVLFLDCGPTMIAGGSGSEVVGSLVDGNGKAVAGAEVVLDTAISDTTPAIDSAAVHRFRDTSDARGNFRISLGDNGNGIYTINCSANSGALVAFKSNVLVNRPSNYNGIYPVPVDTLTMLPPGTISGKVLINATSMVGIICYIPGTSFMAMSDTAGGFTILGVPPGIYNVYYYITGYETGKTMSVAVVSNQTTVLPVKVLSLDPLGAPLPPIGLSASADTVTGTVNLSWRSVKVSDLVGYVVLRKTPADLDFTQITATPVTDTFYSDIIFNSPQDTVTKTFIYSIRAVDSDNNKSANSKSVQITVPPPSYVRPFIQLSRVSPLNDTASAGDMVKIAVYFSSYLTKTISLTWRTGDADSGFIRYFVDVDAKQGADTLSYVWNSSGIKEVYLDALDERGSTWRDSMAITIRPRAVSVTAVLSTDSTVKITWQKSPDAAFAQYRLFCADTGAGVDVLVASFTNIIDTGYTIATWKNGIKKYRVKVLGAQGLLSNSGASASGGIINTPTRITTDTSAIVKAANAGVLYHVKLAVADPNRDSISFTQLSSNAGLTISDSALSWVPGISDTGTRHISVRVSDGWGGADTISWDVLVTPSNVWSSIASLLKPRRFLSAAVINGVLYASGGGTLRFDGMNYTISPSNAVEAFSLASGTAWSPVASLPTARYRTACAPLSGTLFSFGGFGSYDYVTTVDSFNPVSNSWGTAGQLPSVRVGAAVCAVGGKLYLIGGQSYAGSFSTVSSNIDEWDPASGWTAKATMKKQRMDHQAVLLNNKIYIIGGLGGSVDPNNCVPEQSVEVYDPAANRLDTAASLNTGRWYFGAAEANGKIYAIGGLYSFDTDSSLTSVEEYDPAQNAWIIKAALPTARFGCSAASWQGKIYVVGGAEKTPTGTKETNSVMMFYP